jgi:hypothetical protein
VLLLLSGPTLTRNPLSTRPSAHLSSLGFEQIFKNALTGLMMGGGKGCVALLFLRPLS